MTHVLRAVVHGRVQGVGYRVFALRRASALGLGGWVSNRDDGAVEVEAEGPRALLQTLLEALEEGPGGAEVSEVRAHWSTRAAARTGFVIR
jgi:acylphosphatase